MKQTSQSNQFKNIQIVVISFIWLLLLAIPLYIFSKEEVFELTKAKYIIEEYLLLFFLFCWNRFVLLPFLFLRSKRLLYFISVVVSIVVAVGLFFMVYRNQPLLPPTQTHTSNTENLRREGFPRNLPQQNRHIPPTTGNRHIEQITDSIRPRYLQADRHRESRPREDRAWEDRLREEPQREIRHRQRTEQEQALHPPETIEPWGNPNGARGKQPVGMIPPFANSIILAVLLIGFDTGLVLAMKWLKSEQERLQLEQENSEIKMNALRNQISPHFFMNTLNNIHSLIDIDGEQAKDAVIKLSRLMGYMLYESNTDKVTLIKEFEFIRSYVNLMKLRFSDKVEIQLAVPNEIPQITIPPLLFISFIENSFKHGVSYQSNSFVHINFQITDNRLYCAIRNSNHAKAKKDKNSGIGVENTKNRLNLLYKKNYNLTIDKKDETFVVLVNIPI